MSSDPYDGYGGIFRHSMNSVATKRVEDMNPHKWSSNYISTYNLNLYQDGRPYTVAIDPNEAEKVYRWFITTFPERLDQDYRDRHKIDRDKTVKKETQSNLKLLLL